MTASTKNPKIAYLVHLMGRINVVNMKFFVGFFTNKALMGIKVKSSLSINPRTFSKVWIPFVTTLEPMKSRLFAFIRTVLRFTRCFRDFVRTTLTTRNLFFPFAVSAPFQKTLPRAKTNALVFTSRYIRRSFNKYNLALFTSYRDFFIPREIVARPRTVFGSISGEGILTCGADFHRPIVDISHG